MNRMTGNRRGLTVLAAAVAFAAVASIAAPGYAQTLEQRMEHLRQKQQEADLAAAREVAESKTGQFLVGRVRTGGGLMEVPAKQAFEFIAVASGVPIIVNWNALAELGIEPDQPVTLVGPDMTGERALDMIVAQIDVDGQLMWEPTSHYVRVMTKAQANKEQVVRVYPIGDLLMSVPDFGNAPQFDLTEVTRAPASGGGAASSPFEQADGEEQTKTMEERGQEIANVIRETIEPDLWREAGGDGGSIRYWHQHLIVSAPKYVHQQIVGDVHVPGSPTVRPVEIAPGRIPPGQVLADAAPGAPEQPVVRASSGPAEAAVRHVRTDQVFVSTPRPADGQP